MDSKIVLFYGFILILIHALEASPRKAGSSAPLKRKSDAAKITLPDESQSSNQPPRKRRVNVTAPPAEESLTGERSVATIASASSATSTNPMTVRRMFVCIYCGIEFTSRDGRSSHEFFTHEGNYVRCSACGFEYTMRPACDKHLINTECGGTCEVLHRDGWITDPIKFDVYGGLLEIRAQPTSELMVYCRFCNNDCGDVPARIAHERYVHEGNYEECIVCNRDFRTREECESHVHTTDCVNNYGGCVTLTVEGFRPPPMIYNGHGGILLQGSAVASGSGADEQVAFSISAEHAGSDIIHVTESTLEKLFCFNCNLQCVDAPARRAHERKYHEHWIFECSACHKQYLRRPACNKHRKQENDCFKNGGKCVSRCIHADPVNFTGHGGRILSDASGDAANRSRTADPSGSRPVTGSGSRAEAGGESWTAAPSGSMAMSGSESWTAAPSGSMAMSGSESWTAAPSGSMAMSGSESWTAAPSGSMAMAGSESWTAAPSGSSAHIYVPPFFNSANDDENQIRDLIEDWTTNPMINEDYGGFPRSDSSGLPSASWSSVSGPRVAEASGSATRVNAASAQVPDNNAARNDEIRLFYPYEKDCTYCGEYLVDYAAYKRHMDKKHPAHQIG